LNLRRWRKKVLQDFGVELSEKHVFGRKERKRNKDYKKADLGEMCCETMN
jgi:hypothetical protein